MKNELSSLSLRERLHQLTLTTRETVSLSLRSGERVGVRGRTRRNRSRMPTHFQDRVWVRVSLFAAMLLSSTIAAAEVPTLSLSTGYSTQVFTARGYDLIGTDDNLHQGRVALGTGFTLPFGALDLEVAFAAGGTKSVTHQSIPVDYALRGLQLGVAYRIPVTAWFQPYAQVLGGYDWATLTLASTERLTQTSGSFSGSGLLGVQFAVRMGGPKEPRVPQLIFDLGAGAVLRQESKFDAMSPEQPKPAPADPLAVSSVNLGTVPLSGFTMRLLVGVRY
jgi:hypothetical protein